MKPALSIAIAASDDELSIGRCIESVLASAAQAREPVEVVVALHRSTDKTRAIAESLGARCLRHEIIHHGAPRNTAVRAASAPAIATLAPAARLGLSAIASMVDYVYDGAYIAGRMRAWPERASIGSLGQWLANSSTRHGASTGTFWFARESFEAVGGFDASAPGGEDRDFAVKLRALGKARGKKYTTLHGVFAPEPVSSLLRAPRLADELFDGRSRPVSNSAWFDKS
jgi:glycosyltransferase involved in cell wall biosynthesis